MGQVGWEKSTAETLVNIVEKKGFPSRIPFIIFIKFKENGTYPIKNPEIHSDSNGTDLAV